jgi:hypothetical protein
MSALGRIFVVVKPAWKTVGLEKDGLAPPRWGGKKENPISNLNANY